MWEYTLNLLQYVSIKKEVNKQNDVIKKKIFFHL